MFSVGDFIKEVTDGAAEVLTGVFNLGGAPSAQFQDFVSGIGNGNETMFEVTDGSKSEAWLGTVTDGAPDTLTGVTFLGSTTGAQINWGAGVKTITCGLSAKDYITLPGAADETLLTIATGSVTPTRGQHAIDTEASAGTDDLANIVTTNLRNGRWVLIRANNAARTVVVKHAAGGAGQIHLADAADFTLDDADKSLLLRRRAGDWHEIARAQGGGGTAALADTGILAGNVPILNADAQIEPIIGGTPIGAVIDYAPSAAPTGWLLCDGAAVSRTTYAKLFTAIGTTHGIGDGSTTFNVPDARGRVIAGQDDMGGVSADRLTALSGGVDGDVLGAVGGSESHTLTSAESVAHTHATGTLAVASGGAHTHNVNGYTGSGGITGLNYRADGNTSQSFSTTSTGAHVHTLSGSTASSGSNGAHNNVQPTLILNKIIFAGA